MFPAHIDYRKTLQVILSLAAGCLFIMAMHVQAQAAKTQTFVIPMNDGYGIRECLLRIAPPAARSWPMPGAKPMGSTSPWLTDRWRISPPAPARPTRRNPNLAPSSSAARSKWLSGSPSRTSKRPSLARLPTDKAYDSAGALRQ